MRMLRAAAQQTESESLLSEVVVQTSRRDQVCRFSVCVFKV